MIAGFSLPVLFGLLHPKKHAKNKVFFFHFYQSFFTHKSKFHNKNSGDYYEYIPEK
jgi:hypothetical protein